jgi:putative ABC transport system permease protein
MLRHYLVTALRAFARHKLYSFINIVGFAVGLACAILIVLYVRDELSYDKWIPGTEHLYRLEATTMMPGREPWRTAQVQFPVMTLVQQHIRQVKAATRMLPQSMTVNIGDKQFRETVTAVDPNFFSVIKLPLVEGDPQRALVQPDSIVLSRSVARKFFGDADPLGKVLVVVLDRNAACDAGDNACLSQAYPLTVRGILRDLPYNTQLVADLVIPNTSRADQLAPSEKEYDWTAMDGDYGYVELKPGATPADVLSALGPILDRAFDMKGFGISLRASEFYKYRLTPFQDAHLTSDQYYGMTPAGSWTTVYGLSAIALLIVLIACFNFMNLATARATLRAREIALRKLGGARRWQLLVQFLGEAVLTALISFVVALALIELLLPVYDRILHRPIQFHYVADWQLLVVLFAGAVGVGLLSGLYPALVLAAFRPAASLKAGISVRGSPGMLRSVLVVAQFAISIGLGITALVMFKQVDFARAVDLGFHRDGIVVVRGISKLTPSVRESLARALSADPRIVGVAYSNGVPFDLFSTSGDQIRAAGAQQYIAAQFINFDPQTPSLYDMRLLAGRLLSKERGEDISTREHSRNVLINAAATRGLGFTPEQALGKSIVIGKDAAARVVGVLSDTSLEGMRESIKPAVFYFDTADSHAMTLLSIRLRGDGIAATLAFIDKTWRQWVPGTAIDRYFLADAFDKLFESDERQGDVLSICVGIAIFIACLGLFGLAVFTAERRTKEIGMRKISGARTFDIVQRLLWQISIPVLIANAIAWPTAYAYLTYWLDGYANRISLNPVYFLAAGAGALLVAWATILAHAVRLARASPIHALRYE